MIKNRSLNREKKFRLCLKINFIRVPQFINLKCKICNRDCKYAVTNTKWIFKVDLLTSISTNVD